MDAYEKLAKVLDTIPNGFPATAGGEHLAVLKWIFTPEEADLATSLKLRGETCEEIGVVIEYGEPSSKIKIVTNKIFTPMSCA